MKILKTLTIAMLGSAALLPALPAWADDSKPQAAATDTAKPASAPATPAATTPPLTVTGKPGSADTGARDKWMEMRRADHKAFMDARLAALHAGLQLTPEQQPLWSPVEAALRDFAKIRHDMRHAMRHDMHAEHASDQNTDPAARLKQRGEHLVAMGQAMGKLADATGPLLGSLTPEQKHRLPMLIHGVGPHRLVKQAFGIEGGHEWGREGIRFGMHGGMRDREGGDMRDGERDGWRHRHFADRDGGPDAEHRDSNRGDRADMNRPDMNRPDMERGGDGWRGRHHGWDREGRADRDGMDGGRFDREDGPSRHHQHDGDDGDSDRKGG